MSNKITIEQAKEQISEGFSSIFSKDDVLHLLDCISTKKENLITKEMLVTFISGYVETQVEQLDSQDILDFDTAQFELNNGCELSLTCIDIDNRDLRINILGDIDDSVDYFLNHTLPELI
jgi:hypothetical protein